nr:immunoglobulin light chain junction region [Macaca mulatta]
DYYCLIWHNTAWVF